MSLVSSSDTGLLRAGSAPLLSWTEVREALGGCSDAGSWLPELTEVSTDSRTLQPGALFFALTGPNFDGHDYLSDARARGAGGFVVRRGTRLGPDLPADHVIEVDDPEQALGRLGGYLRSRWDGRLVAVTGSFGKTTTKEMIGRLLGPREEVLVSPGTENNAIGVPRLLARLTPDHRFAVVEMGTNHPGEIAHLTDLAEPDVAVITGIGAAHLEGLGDLDGVAREKGAILRSCGVPRIAVLNGDDARVRAVGEMARAVSDIQCVYYGFSASNDVRAAAVEPDALGLRFKIEGRRVNLPLLGLHNVLNALAAYAVGRELGLRPVDLCDRLEALGPVRQRMEPFLYRGSLIIDDTYNANPPAMRAALSTLQQLDISGRRVLVAGEMKELGVGAEVLHREIGKAASDCGIDVLWAIGPLAIFYLEGARRHGAEMELRHLETAGAAAAPLREFLRPGDAVLVKGSRSARLEQVTRALREGTSQDAP
jgi:UDP-N-acetylmuramoyl-tripeptide--D-alanyl-D-alanine ligase